MYDPPQQDTTRPEGLGLAALSPQENHDGVRPVVVGRRGVATGLGPAAVLSAGLQKTPMIEAARWQPRRKIGKVARGRFHALQAE